MEEADIEVTDIAELRKRKCKKVLAERDTVRSRPVHTAEPARSHSRAVESLRNWSVRYYRRCQLRMEMKTGLADSCVKRI